MPRALFQSAVLRIRKGDARTDLVQNDEIDPHANLGMLVYRGVHLFRLLQQETNRNRQDIYRVSSGLGESERAHCGCMSFYRVRIFPRVIWRRYETDFIRLRHLCIIGDMAADRIPIPELKKKLDSKNKPIVVDVREAGEIKEGGAIPGAIHIPMAHLEKRMGELPKNAAIVFY